MYSRVVVQEDDRQDEHEERPDHPVLHERKAEDLVVAEDVAELLVAHLGKRRIHHHDEADGDGDVGRAHLKRLMKAGTPGKAQPRPTPIAMARKIQSVR